MAPPKLLKIDAMNKLAYSVALVSCFAIANASDELRNTIKRDSSKIAKYMMKKDFKGMEKHLKSTTTPDFKYIEAGNTINLKQMIAQMKMGMGQFTKVTKVDSKVLTVQQQGNKANVTMMHAVEGKMKGPDKKTHTMRMSGNTIESYVKVGSKWKLAVMDWKESQMMMDGKPMAMPGEKQAPK